MTVNQPRSERAGQWWRAALRLERLGGFGRDAAQAARYRAAKLDSAEHADTDTLLLLLHNCGAFDSKSRAGYGALREFFPSRSRLELVVIEARSRGQIRKHGPRVYLTETGHKRVGWLIHAKIVSG